MCFKTPSMTCTCSTHSSFWPRAGQLRQAATSADLWLLDTNMPVLKDSPCGLGLLWWLYASWSRRARRQWAAALRGAFARRCFGPGRRTMRFGKGPYFDPVKDTDDPDPRSGALVSGHTRMSLDLLDLWLGWAAQYQTCCCCWSAWGCSPSRLELLVATHYRLYSFESGHSCHPWRFRVEHLLETLAMPWKGKIYIFLYQYRGSSHRICSAWSPSRADFAHLEQFGHSPDFPMNYFECRNLDLEWNQYCYWAYFQIYYQMS